MPEQTKPLRHEWNDDGCCIHCGYDGAEADYYSRRGYAHEYSDLKGPCRERARKQRQRRG